MHCYLLNNFTYCLQEIDSFLVSAALAQVDVQRSAPMPSGQAKAWGKKGPGEGGLKGTEFFPTQFSNKESCGQGDFLYEVQSPPNERDMLRGRFLLTRRAFGAAK